jgi:hypothetical protein
MLPENASSNAGAESAGSVGSIPAKSFERPLLAQVKDFFESLRKGKGDFAQEWFEDHGLEERWLSEDWKKSASRWFFDRLRHDRVIPE